MNPVKMFLNSLKKKAIEKRINHMVEQKDSYKAICQQGGQLLGLFGSAIVDGVINSAVSQKEMTIEFYARNHKSIEKVMSGIIELFNPENIEAYKNSLKGMTEEIKKSLDNAEIIGGASAQVMEMLIESVAKKESEFIAKAMTEAIDESTTEHQVSGITVHKRVYRSDMDESMFEYLKDTYDEQTARHIANRFNNNNVTYVKIYKNNLTGDIDLKSCRD